MRDEEGPASKQTLRGEWGTAFLHLPRYANKRGRGQPSSLVIKGWVTSQK
jgi:hypothetical protein